MSKIIAEKLPHILSKSLKPIYVISGDETLLIEEACSAVRVQAKKNGFEQHEIHEVDGKFNWENILMSANAMSLFSEKKIIEVRIKNGKPGDAGGKALKAYCENISEDNLLLVVLPKIDKRSESTAWFKALSQIGDTITIWPINAQQLPRWLSVRAQSAGLTIEPEAIDILVAKVEGNLLAAAQEIEKLKLLSSEKTINAEIMIEAVTDSARYNVFDLIDKALNSDAHATGACLAGLKAEGTQATIILWALSSQIRSLTQVLEALQAGHSFDTAARQAKIWKNKLPLINRASQRLSLNETHKLLRQCMRIDRLIKGVSKGDEWNEILDVCLSLSGVSALSKRTQMMSLNQV